MLGKFDQMAQQGDDAAAGFLGYMKDPEMAPPGQQSMDPISIVSGWQDCEIKEKASAIEAMSALAGEEFEMPNKYFILSPQGQPTFFIKESTDMCTRQAGNMCKDCAAWNVDMRVINGQGQAEEAFKMERPWTCTCCCFQRPTVTISDAKGQVLGTMLDPFRCSCKLDYDIKDSDGADLLAVRGDCCQWGLCCPMPCGPCAEVTFTAEDSDGKEVGVITKQTPSCLTFLAAPDVDNYKLEFDGASEIDKILMMAVSVFIDFQYFSENANKDDSDGDMIPDRFDFD